MPARLHVLGVLFFVLHTAGAAAAAMPHEAAMTVELHRIEVEWARITYQVGDRDAQYREMRSLAGVVAELVKRYPGRAEPLIWQGIVTSSEAEYAGLVSALGFAEEARDLFERAGRIDYRAVDGAVPTSLGALYYLVPGFPFGFGDDDKARQYLEQGVQIAPNGLHANYYYGDFLYRQGEYGKAAAVLRHALEAPADPRQPVADAGRRAEIRAVLAKAQQKQASRR